VSGKVYLDSGEMQKGVWEPEMGRPKRAEVDTRGRERQTVRLPSAWMSSFPSHPGLRPTGGPTEECKEVNWVPMVHACNPSNSGGRDQEDRGLEASPGKQFSRPYLRKTLHKKRAGGVAQGVGPEFKFQYHRKRKKKKKNAKKAVTHVQPWPPVLCGSWPTLSLSRPQRVPGRRPKPRVALIQLEVPQQQLCSVLPQYQL
jgi:hypothetical protein